MHVLVTGGSGKLGSAVVRELVECGHDVLSVDVRPPREAIARAQIVDVCDFGELVQCLRGCDAVVHLAAIPAPGFVPDERTFRTNLTSTFGVFEASRLLGVRRVVWASSETIFGMPFEQERPAYVPFDEQHPSYPESGYALAKLLGEEIGRQFHRRAGIVSAALRFSNILEPHEYERLLPGLWADARARRLNLWSYVDVRDAARACRLSLEADVDGAEVLAIAAADTLMNRPTADLLAEFFPDVPVRGALLEFGALLSSAKAKALLGYEPRHSWRDSTFGSA